jgi:PKD repeat protein
VTLSWDANSELNLAGYKIYYKTDFSGPPYDGIGADEGDSPIAISLNDLNDSDYPQYTIHGLKETETYFFVVTAYVAEGEESSYSNEVYNLCSHVFPSLVDAGFSASPRSGYKPLSVNFSDQSAGGIESWSWDFGDGAISIEQNPLHTYLEARSYEVRLIVSGPDGCDAETMTDFIVVHPETIGVDEMETGRFESSGKGKLQTQTFVTTDTFVRGDEVIIRAYLEDLGTGVPVAGATAEITISDSENTILISNPSNDDGVAEVTWKTLAPKKKGKQSGTGGTMPGIYEATVTNISAPDHTWDGVNTLAVLAIQ